jgi:enoyl-[acyl-carrier protein] reductase/trans-2-enoyl-CoA reductase (NAD+)
MIVKPKIRNNICITAHPSGCALQVREQIEYVLRSWPSRGGERAGLDGSERLHRGERPRAVLIGSSNGYGLAARIAAAFGCGASTVGVAFEKPGAGARGGTRTGTAGWYNDRAFLLEAGRAGIPAWSVNGDAFSRETKAEVLAIAGRELGRVDLLVYSIASPRRTDPDTGAIYSTAIKPIGGRFDAKTVDFLTGRVIEVSMEPASDEEAAHTVKVMGGEDWELWVDALEDAGLLSQGFTTVAFSYIGPAVTSPIYREGTIGRAKAHLEATAEKLHARLRTFGGKALVSINKALVTRASAVIPAVPLYVALLYRVMKAKGIHEGCVEQMVRLFRDYLCTGGPLRLDEKGRIRLDDLEMREDVQREVASLWREVDTGNLSGLADIEGFREEFLRHHGFAMEGIDYGADVEV